jgi:folate-dependent tRNA-U54 methylase TrmFO/GidA
MNANYGLMPDLKSRARGREKKIEMGTRAIAAFEHWIDRKRLEPAASDSGGGAASIRA